MLNTLVIFLNWYEINISGPKLLLFVSSAKTGTMKSDCSQYFTDLLILYSTLTLS